MSRCPELSDIINPTVYEYIMDDLSHSQPFNMLLHGNEYVDVDEICDSTQENTQVQIVNGHGAERLVMAIPNDVRSPTGSLPCLDRYSGPYGFDVMLSSSNNSRHAWVYSSKLDKVFIDVEKVLLMQFKLENQTAMGLRVRALLVYIIPDHMNQPVNRCTLHTFRCDPNHQAHANKDVCLCTSYNLAGHVVTTDNANAEYNHNSESGRHSVVVPLDMPQAGSDSTTIAYQFGCKTSCAGGMSRRPTKLIFTLENEHGQVVGRNSLAVKVCSCPKRDKEREESDDYTRDEISYIESPKVPGTKRRATLPADRLQIMKSIKLEGIGNQVPETNISILHEQIQRNHAELLEQNERHQVQIQRNHAELIEQNERHQVQMQRNHAELLEQNERHIERHHSEINRLLANINASNQELIKKLSHVKHH